MEVSELPRGSYNEQALSLQDSGLINAAYDQQVTLVGWLGALRDLLQANPTIQHDAIHSLQSAELSAQQVASSIEQCIRALPIALRPTPGSDMVATRVFDIPEVAERILLNLDTVDLLRAQQVNTTMFATINHSPRLRRKLFLQPDLDAFLTPIDPVLAQPFSIDVRFGRDNEILQESKPVCRVSIRSPGSPSSQQYHPGSQIWRMLICQPPILELEAHPMCRCSDGRMAAHLPANTALPRVQLTSKTGFTLQELWDAAESIRHRHRLCPHAEPDEHDSEGFVDGPIKFQAHFELQDSDPRLIARLARQNTQSQLETEYVQTDRRLGRYIAAKITAFNLGQPIPTLAEFEAF